MPDRRDTQQGARAALKTCLFALALLAFMPPATPPKIIEQLNATVRRTSTMPDIQKRFSSLGAELIAESPKEFAAFVKGEIHKWAKVVKDSGIQPE